jgi:hypothetical protein
MEINFNNLGQWETKKALFLCQIAKDKLNWDLSGYGMCDVNHNSGNTFLWLEDYPVAIYMSIYCDYTESDVWVIWTNPENGEEFEKTLDEFNSMNDIYKWVESLEEREEEV